MPKPMPVELPRWLMPYPPDSPSRTTVEDLFVVLRAHGKLTSREYARFMLARAIVRRLCNQILLKAWQRGDLDDR
jgi:hypothetical protein